MALRACGLSLVGNLDVAIPTQSGAFFNNFKQNKMQHPIKISKNRSTSKFLGQRRKFFLTKRTAKIGLNFLKINKGSVTRTNMPSGSVRLTFKSKYTGRTALAYGCDFFHAYENLVRLFYLKYSVL